MRAKANGAAVFPGSRFSHPATVCSAAATWVGVNTTFDDPLLFMREPPFFRRFARRKRANLF
jgi:hypothetical protein